jgi:hypothetical protein
MRTAGIVVAAMALVEGALLPGCVAWEIRDEVRRANTHLGEVRELLVSLEQTKESIDRVNATLVETNALIRTADEGIDSANVSLRRLEERLAVLDSMQSTLVRLDGHLASVRETIIRIDSAIPVGSIVGDEPPPTTPEKPAERPGEQRP